MAKKKAKESTVEGDSNSENSDDSDVEKSKREDERGRTVLALVGKATQNGTKIPLEWHPLYKIPCGHYKPIFSTYIGVVVRERVNITYSTWKKVPKETLDELYDVIARGFTIRGDRRKWILRQADERWRAFKTRLRNRWLHHKKSGRIRRMPPWKYPWITQTIWDEFIKNCEDEKFKVLSEQGRERSKKKKNSYRGGRLGYQYFEEQIRKEIEKEGVHVDHVPRHETWLRAHSKEKDGVRTFNNPIDQEIANAINALKAQSQRGEIVIKSRREDILARAFKKPEHGGSVRGVGSSITNREYFGTNTPISSSDLHAQIQNLQSQVSVMMSFIMSGMSQGQMRPMWTNDASGFLRGFTGHVGQEMAREKNSSDSFMHLLFGGDVGQQINDDTNEQENKKVQTNSGNKEAEPYRVPWPNSSDLHQHDQDVQSSQQCNPRELEKCAPCTPENEVTGYDTQPLTNHNLPQGLHDCCLAIETDNKIQIVALGEVYIAKETEVVRNHGTIMQQGCCRVSVSKDIVPTALLPCPTADLTVVCQAVETFVPWPTHLIFPKKSPKKQISTPSQQPPSSQGTSTRKYVITEDDRAKVTSGLLEVLKREAIRMKESNVTTKLLIPQSVFFNEQLVTLDYEDLLDWCFQREMGVSHISIFMRGLSEMCKKDGISGMYGFIDPNYISSMTPTEEEERSDYLCRAFGCNGGKNINQLFFAPYHENRHCMLVAISPWNGTIFWLDPAGKENEIRPFAQRIINEGIKKFSLIYRKDIKQVKKDHGGIKWFKPECPRQAQNTKDCGYYVCRYMKETIASRRPLVPNKYFEEIATYSQDLIDEIRDSWVSYVLKNQIVNTEQEGRTSDAIEI